MVSGLRPYSERIGEGLGLPPFDADHGELLMNVVPSTAIVFDNRPPESPGTLYVSTKRVIWLSNVDMEKGYAVDFLSLSLHAVSKDPEAYPSPCLYAQIDTGTDEESENSDSERCSDTLDLAAVREIRLVPSDPDTLETLFEIFCYCAELNPDPTGDEEEEGNNWFFSADQLGLGQMRFEISGDHEDHFSTNPTNSIGHSNGDHDHLAHTVLQLQINDKRFEDADEMEPGGDVEPGTDGNRG